MAFLLCLDHVIKKAKYDISDESRLLKHQLHGKHRKNKEKKKKSNVTLAENVLGSSTKEKEQATSSYIRRLPHSAAQVSANWKQLIQVKLYNAALIASTVEKLVQLCMFICYSCVCTITPRAVDRFG